MQLESSKIKTTLTASHFYLYDIFLTVISLVFFIVISIIEAGFFSPSFSVMQLQKNIDGN